MSRGPTPDPLLILGSEDLDDSHPAIAEIRLRVHREIREDRWIKHTEVIESFVDGALIVVHVVSHGVYIYKGYASVKGSRLREKENRPITASDLSYNVDRVVFSTDEARVVLNGLLRRESLLDVLAQVADGGSNAAKT